MAALSGLTEHNSEATKQAGDEAVVESRLHINGFGLLAVVVALAAASREQETGMNQMNQAIVTIDSTTQQNAARLAAAVKVFRLA